MFHPHSDLLQHYHATSSARKYQMQKFHGCDILLPPNTKERKTHLYDNRVRETSVETTASQHDTVALKSNIKKLEEYIQERTKAHQRHLEYHQVVIGRHEVVIKEQAHTIDAFKTENAELKSQNISLHNQMKILVKNMPAGRTSV